MSHCSHLGNPQVNPTVVLESSAACACVRMDHIYFSCEEEIVEDTPSEAPTAISASAKSKSKGAEKRHAPESTKRNWSKPEIDALLDIWLDMKDLIEEKGPRAPIFSLISKKMSELNFKRDEYQIQRKMGSLRAQFRAANNKKTGSSSSNFIYLEKMRQITSKSHYVNDGQVDVVASGTRFNSPSIGSSSTDFSSTKKRKCDESEEMLISILKKFIENSKCFVSQMKLMNQNLTKLADKLFEE